MLSHKLHDLSIILARFREALGDRYLTEEDIYTAMCGAVLKSKKLRGAAGLKLTAARHHIRLQLHDLIAFTGIVRLELVHILLREFLRNLTGTRIGNGIKSLLRNLSGTQFCHHEIRIVDEIHIPVFFPFRILVQFLLITELLHVQGIRLEDQLAVHQRIDQNHNDCNNRHNREQSSDDSFKQIFLHSRVP